MQEHRLVFRRAPTLSNETKRRRRPKPLGDYGSHMLSHITGAVVWVIFHDELHIFLDYDDREGCFPLTKNKLRLET